MSATPRRLLLLLAPLLGVLLSLPPGWAQEPGGLPPGGAGQPASSAAADPLEGLGTAQPVGEPGQGSAEPQAGEAGAGHGAEEPPTHGAHDDTPLGISAGVVRRVSPGEGAGERLLSVELTAGESAGKTVTVVQRGGGPQGLELPVGPGDRVVLTAVPTEEAGEFDWQVVDYQRGHVTLGLIGLTALLILGVGGWRGLKTLAVLGFTGVAIAGILLPLTLRGWSPLPLAVLLAAGVSVTTTLLTSGAGRKTWAAVLGTTGAIALAALLAAVFVTLGRLSGLASEEALMAHAGHAAIDAPGLLAASVLVGALGVILDLSLSIAAAVDELRRANPQLPRRALLQAGWEVGRDLLSTTANTLLLAYLGGFLPVLLSLGVQPMGWLRLGHLEAINVFGTTLLVGLCGLVLAVPLTAFAAARLASPASPRVQPGTTEF
ncbi:MAG: YibE/F family protein [Candidatus Sericytochromatia bacterium]|nr:YibE/F family protein [Candidatus Sericytochromatia bacterium]